MAAIDISTGFHISAPVGIDDRLVLTKEEMLNMNDGLMPESYFALCSEDNKLYVYNKSNTPNEVTGKFNPLVGDSKYNVTVDDLSELLGKPAESHVVTEEESTDEESKYFGKEVGSVIEEPSTGAFAYIDKSVSDGIDGINNQTTYATYTTVEQASNDTVTIVMNNIEVLQPKQNIIKADTTWYNPETPELKISSLADLRGLTELMKDENVSFENQTVYLDGNIDGHGEVFEPIGTTEIPSNITTNIYNTSESNMGDKIFKGTFDGNGYTISNLKIVNNNPDSNKNNSAYGFFGLVANGSTIKNVTLENVTIESEKGSMVSSAVGYIAKVDSSSDGTVTTIENVHVKGNVNVSGSYGVGVILGRSEAGEGSVIIRNCSVEGNDPDTSIIEATHELAFVGVGAIAGAIYGSGENIIENCTVKNVTVRAPAEGVGGLVGHFETGIIRNNTIENVKVINGMDINSYMQEGVTAGIIAGTIDSKITKPTGTPRVTLEGNTITNCEVHIPSGYTNTGNASGVALDENGLPDWEAWSVVGTPRNHEYIDPTPFVICDQDFKEIRKNITIYK